MDYATLGPSELQPSLFDGYALALLQRSLSQSKVGQVSIIMFPSVKFAMICVFIKQSLIPILSWHVSAFAVLSCHTFFRSYSVNLQSSLNILVLLILAIFARLPVLDCSTVSSAYFLCNDCLVFKLIRTLQLSSQHYWSSDNISLRYNIVSWLHISNLTTEFTNLGFLSVRILNLQMTTDLDIVVWRYSCQHIVVATLRTAC